MSASTTEPTARKGRITLYLGAIVIALLVAAAATMYASSRPSHVEAGDVDVIIAGKKWWGSQGTKVASIGTLALIDDCLGIRQGDRAFVAVWPEGTQVSGSDEQIILQVDEQELHIGDVISFGPSSAPSSLPAGCNPSGAKRLHDVRKQSASR